VRVARQKTASNRVAGNRGKVQKGLRLMNAVMSPAPHDARCSPIIMHRACTSIRPREPGQSTGSAISDNQLKKTHSVQKFQTPAMNEFQGNFSFDRPFNQREMKSLLVITWKSHHHGRPTSLHNNGIIGTTLKTGANILYIILTSRQNAD
jgi:hypothetical protein